MRSVILGLLLLATSGMAQGTNQITLKYDDGSGVSGELIEYTGDIFRIQASIGLIAIAAQDVSCIGVACPEGTALEVPSAPVTLTSLDGSLRVSGNVIEVSEGAYIVATDLGEMRIEANLVSCEGAGCVVMQKPLDRTVILENGTTKIEGKLLQFEGGNYVINVDQLGELRVNGQTFVCRGVACP